jgi:cation diffusion facilitator family transporter
MHAHSTENFRHEHVFLGEHHERNERKTWFVIVLCGAMMAAEIAGGTIFGSMALIADGLHMSTHAGALLIAALAYTYARKHARDQRFTFGTGKLGELAGYSSALILAMIAAFIAFESVSRLFQPVVIHFDEALPIAGLGLIVNLLSAWLLRDDHHEEDHAHDHGALTHTHAHVSVKMPAHKHDTNMRAAFVHVAADAAISVLAIAGLLAGRELGWRWMDPVMGIVGACVIANWSWGLLRAAGANLLDMWPTELPAEEIRSRLEVGADRVADLHLWRLGPGHYSVIATVVTDQARPAADFKHRLADMRGLSHVTIEVQLCPGAHAGAPGHGGRDTLD